MASHSQHPLSTIYTMHGWDFLVLYLGGQIKEVDIYIYIYIWSLTVKTIHIDGIRVWSNCPQL
jgi:hypothetical protein